jgi:filamentous hemagglutinin
MRDDLGFSQRTAQNAGDLAEIAAQVLAPAAVSSVAKSSFVAAGITKFRNNVAGAFTRAGEGVISGKSIGLSWTGNWFDRGYAFENYLATLPEFAPHRLPPNFKTFDFFNQRTGKAISVKTIDTNTVSRIANPNLIQYQINGYINKMLDFTEYSLQGQPIRSDMILSRELQLAVPVTTNSQQMQQVMNAIEYGRLNDVSVIITKVGK